MVAFLSYVLRFFDPVQELSQLYSTMQAAMAGGERVLELLDTQPAVQDKPGARRDAADRGASRAARTSDWRTGRVRRCCTG